MFKQKIKSPSEDATRQLKFKHLNKYQGRYCAHKREHIEIELNQSYKVVSYHVRNAEIAVFAFNVFLPGSFWR